MNKTNKFKKSLLSISMGAFVLLGFTISTSASAKCGVCSYVPRVGTVQTLSSYPQFERWRDGQWSTFSADFRQYKADTYNQLNNVNSNLSNVIHGDMMNMMSMNGENVKLEDARARARTRDAMMVEKRVNSRPSLGSCANVTKTIASVGGGGRSGGGSNTGGSPPPVVKAAKIEEDVKKFLTESTSSAAATGTKLATKKSLLTCSVAEVKAKHLGCANVTDIATNMSRSPSGNTDIKNAYMGAVNNNVANDNNKPNYTIIPKGVAGKERPNQAAIATDLVTTLIASTPLEAISSAAASTSDGARYMAFRDAFLARTSAITNHFSTMIADSTGAVDAAAKERFDNFNKSVAADGDSFEAIYKRVFPGQQVPNNDKYSAYPSQTEMLRFDVYRRYSDVDPSNSWYSKMSQKTGDDLLKESLNIQAQQSYIMLKMSEKMDKQNNLLSALLAAQQNPITIDGLKGMEQRLKTVSK